MLYFLIKITRDSFSVLNNRLRGPPMEKRKLKVEKEGVKAKYFL